MDRRTVLEAAAIGGLGAASPASAAATESSTRQSSNAERRPHFVNARDGTKLFVQDWGSGRSIVLLSPWALNSDVWGTHIAAFTARGFRCVAPDRRGHGRSEVPTSGYDLDTLADDVASVIEQLDLQQVILVAYSMGASEAVQYLERHGSARISQLVLCAPGTPFLLKTEDNPDGIPPSAAEAQFKAVAHDFPKWIADNEAPFFTPDTIPETRYWIKSMMMSVPLPIVLATLIAPDLRSAISKIRLPTLIIQGDKDASHPLPITGAKTARLIPNCKLVVVEGAPHALILTHRERLLSELLGFIGS
ncbi:MAG: alpha/beta hydrolase [Alphaproteobacteria bacterium]|nr:MAG: alpha/beta hydrolase [Alphaproteobacteria bacterium]